MTCMLKEDSERGEQVECCLQGHFSCIRCTVEASLVEVLEALLEPKEAVLRLSSSSSAIGLDADWLSMTTTQSSSVGVP